MKAVRDFGCAVLSLSGAFLTAWGHWEHQMIDSKIYWRAPAYLYLPSNKIIQHPHLRGEPAWAVRSGAAVSYAHLIPESCAHTLVKSSVSICRCFFFSTLFRRYLIVTAPLGLRPSLLCLYFSSTLSAKPWRPHCAGSCSCGDSRDCGLRTFTATTRRRGSPAGGGTRSCRPTSYRKTASVSWQWCDLMVSDAWDACKCAWCSMQDAGKGLLGSTLCGLCSSGPTSQQSVSQLFSFIQLWQASAAHSIWKKLPIYPQPASLPRPPSPSYAKGCSSRPFSKI